MNSQQAKETLVLYRPGSADAEDPSFAEALQLCESDPDLKQWFEDHCSVYAALRGKFKEIPVPEGLKQQILAERRVHLTPFWRRPVVLASVAAAIVLALLPLLLSPFNHGSTAFLNRMIGNAVRPYGMAEITDPAKIRLYLQRSQAPSDYVVPEGLMKAELMGCAVVQWQGANLSMICFTSGNSPGTTKTTDLWLFVADRDSVPGAPDTRTPSFGKRNRITTARWTEGSRTYLLVAAGDEEFIKKYL